jgi:hypothetical protein
MSKQKQRVEIHPMDDGIIELRHFGDPQSDRPYCWKMPVNEAVGLTKWWVREGVNLKKRELPVDGVKSGSVVVSMCTLKTVVVRATSPYGRPTFRGYSLPREVVDSLAVLIGRDAHSAQQEGTS